MLTRSFLPPSWVCAQSDVARRPGIKSLHGVSRDNYKGRESLIFLLLFFAGSTQLSQRSISTALFVMRNKVLTTLTLSSSSPGLRTTRKQRQARRQATPRVFLTKTRAGDSYRVTHSLSSSSLGGCNARYTNPAYDIKRGLGRDSQNKGSKILRCSSSLGSHFTT